MSRGSINTALIFAAAPLRPTARLRSRLAELDQPYVVAADGGATTALAFGCRPDVVVGDLDSIDAATLAELRQREVPLEAHPRNKDFTDGQLAVERALQALPAQVWLLGFLGGPRLDQAVANVLYLTRLSTPAVLFDEQNECRLLVPGQEYIWLTEPGEVVSLLPLTTSVDGVRSQGLRWPLRAERLVLGETRGVSNEPSAEQASVTIDSGLLLVTRHFPA